jgi:hypothetical protein
MKERAVGVVKSKFIVCIYGNSIVIFLCTINIC